jgi:hypothetical protein
MSTTLTPGQQRDVDRARKLYEAEGPDVLRAIITERGAQVRGPDPYPEAFGLARNDIGDLLAIIDGLTGGGAA